MTRLNFDRRISLGSLLHMGVLLVAVIGAYFALEKNVDGAERTAVQAEQLALRNAQHISDVLDSINKLTTNVEVLSNSMDLGLQMQARESQRLQKQLDEIKARRAGGYP